jgi:hypothetical protein
MKKHINTFILSAIVAAALLAVPVASHAQDNSNATPPAAGPVIKQKIRTAFHGVVAAVDTAAMTLTVGTQTINVTSETLIMRNGKHATLSDIIVGDLATGAFKKDAAGKLNATSIRAMEKPKNEKKKADDATAPAPGN